MTLKAFIKKPNTQTQPLAPASPALQHQPLHLYLNPAGLSTMQKQLSDVEAMGKYFPRAGNEPARANALSC